MYRDIPSIALSTVLGLGLAAGAVQAQDASSAPPPASSTRGERSGRGAHADPDRQLAHLAKQLDLTAAQQDQIKPVLIDHMRQIQTLRADTSLAPKDQMAKIRGLREDSDMKINAVLTDTQKTKYAEMRQQRRRRFSKNSNRVAS